MSEASVNEVSAGRCGGAWAWLAAVVMAVGVAGEGARAGGTELRLEAVDGCLGVGETRVTVDVMLRDAEQPVVGGQFFLEYDAARLTFVGAEPGGGPFIAEIFEAVDQGSGRIVYGVGVLEGVGTQVDSVLARLTFEVMPGVCAEAGLVRFGAGALPTRLTNASGASIEPGLVDLGVVSRDTTAPVVGVPVAVVVRADAGTCGAVLVVAPPVASDGCDGTVVATATRSDGLPLGAPYPVGTTTLTWTVSDGCGNSTTVAQGVEVLPLNTVVATVEMEGLVGAGPHVRCVEFQLTRVGGGAPVVARVEAVFGGGGMAVVEFAVPCGEYACIAARDPRHTLMRRDEDDFGVEGREYRAGFTRGAATRVEEAGFDALPQGNLDGDAWVDVIDFCLFIERYGMTVGVGSGCGVAMTAAHPDLSGDGVVDEADFWPLWKSYLAGAERDCAGRVPSRLLMGIGPLWTNRLWNPRGGPVKLLRVADLASFGVEGFKKADLNGDQVIDFRDLLAFAGGARP